MTTTERRFTGARDPRPRLTLEHGHERMRLYHTSPEPITAIHGDGLFGSHLFFSSRIYVMTAQSTHVTYAVEIDESDVISAGRLFYHPGAARLDALVAEVAGRFDISAETAEHLIEESIAPHEVEGRDIDAWEIQHATARAASILGYRGVAVRDEQGTAYMIDMKGSEADLVQA